MALNVFRNLEISSSTCFRYCLFKLFHLFSQRDLDFSIDIDFHGEMSEMVDTIPYKMR